MECTCKSVAVYIFMITQNIKFVVGVTVFELSLDLVLLKCMCGLQNSLVIK